MPNYRIPPVVYRETDLFKDWLTTKGYTWPQYDYARQEELLAEEMREGLASVIVCRASSSAKADHEN